MKKHYQDFSWKILNRSIKSWEAIHSIVIIERKNSLIETYSSKVFDLTLHKEFLKEKKSHMKYLKKSP